MWHKQYVKRINRAVQRSTLRRLELIHAARDVEDLRIPPGNRLERLVGDRRGQHSMRVNAQWRLYSQPDGSHSGASNRMNEHRTIQVRKEVSCHGGQP